MRRVAIGIGLVLMVAGALLWRCHGTSSSSKTSASPAAPTTATRSQRRVDPAKLVRGSIRGSVTDEAKRAIAGARVCAIGANDELDPELLREPRCVASDARGAYVIDQLLPATYDVGASARSYQPRSSSTRVSQAASVVDLVLLAGGVELTGVVVDVTGGPIADAVVWTDGAFTQTDARGEFVLWVAALDQDVRARADGYCDRTTHASPPGKMQILMTPEATLAGVVLDAQTNEPVAGARVTVRVVGGYAGITNAHPEDAFSDERGRFRALRMNPGRYTVVARTDHSYGRSETSVQLGLGERVEGVVVKSYPAVRLDGSVMYGTQRRCDAATVTLGDPSRGHTIVMHSSPAGQWAEGVLPGTYEVRVECPDAVSKPAYPPIVVADRDLANLVWEVDEGFAIEGRVTSRSGAPVAGAWLRTNGAQYRQIRSRGDGSYRLPGLPPGTYHLHVGAEMLRFDTEVTVERADAKRDVVLDDTGTVTGVLVDTKGRPVARQSVDLESVDDKVPAMGSGRTDASGAFTIRGVLPGVYKIWRVWEAKNFVTVRANEVVTKNIVVADLPTGEIRGVVLDHAGKPVTDAYIDSSWEEDGRPRSFDRSPSAFAPVITNNEGAFVLTEIGDQLYSVLAYRRGGAEAIAAGVKSGSHITIRLPATAALTGLVQQAGKPLDEFEVSVTQLEDPVERHGTAFARRERFFRTTGRFTMSGLMARRYRVIASAAGSQATVDIDLTRPATPIVLDLDPLIEISGRVLDHPNGKPLAGIEMGASRTLGSSTFANRKAAITDAGGRFKITDAPRGNVQLWGTSPDGDRRLTVVRTLSSSADVGDLFMPPPWGDRLAWLGVQFATIDPDLPADQRALVVEAIDPDGPAASSELKVGDVIVSIDGLDMTGGNSAQATSFMLGQAGAKVVLKTKRGVVVELVR